MREGSFLWQRPLVCCAAVLALGILAGQAWAGFAVLYPALGLLLGLLAFCLSRWNKASRLISACLAFLMLGILLGGFSKGGKLPYEGSYRVSGQVVSESKWSQDGQRVVAHLTNTRLHTQEGQEFKAGLAYWTYYAKIEEPLPQDGQSVDFLGQVYHPKGQVNPFGFDFKGYLQQRGIYIGITGNEGLKLSPQLPEGPKNPVLRLRQALEKRLDALFTSQSGLAKALLIGVKDDLQEEVTKGFKAAGIAHVLAVSGLHVGFLVAGLLLVLRPLNLSPKIRLLVLSVLLLAYCFLLDFAPSVVRASLLAVLLLLGKATRRRVDPLTSLAAAFLLILLLRPSDLFNLGFQLSFLAVLGIITLGDRFNQLLLRWERFATLPSFVQGIFKAYAITLAASLFTLVPLVNAFHQFSLIGLLFSPLAIALIGFLMAGFAVLLLLSFVSLPLALFFTPPVIFYAASYEALVAFFTSLPLATISLPYIHLMPALAFYLSLWLMSRYAKIKGRRAALAIGALAALCLLALGLTRDSRVSYIQLSNGFADSAVIMDREKTFVLDTGESSGDLTNLLLSLGREVDHLIITHLHEDHAGGLTKLIDAGVVIHQVYLPQGALLPRDLDSTQDTLALCEAAGIPVATLKRGDFLTSDRVSVKVLWPYRDAVYPGLSANDTAMVTLWDLDGLTLLNTSDLSARYAAYALAPAQVLKVAHHGSKADNNRDLLDLVSPQLAIITADDFREERYQNTARTLDQLGARLLITGESGAVTLKVDKGQTELFTFLSGRE